MQMYERIYMYKCVQRYTRKSSSFSFIGLILTHVICTLYFDIVILFTYSQKML